ncbi:MAG TPA: hypothetical protein PLZ57_16450 [Pseudobdellovibrionaceae bacterium]|nr:hypothetical protein [Pseudobdellovibrionaceae bacterium]
MIAWAEFIIGIVLGAALFLFVSFAVAKSTSQDDNDFGRRL